MINNGRYPEKEERPYQPETPERRVAEVAALIMGQDRQMRPEYEKTARQVLAAALKKIFQTDTERYELCKWLTGKASTKEMDIAHVLALLRWLNVNSFYDAPSDDAHREAIAAHAYALALPFGDDFGGEKHE